jgi:dihydropteroate synthase
VATLPEPSGLPPALRDLGRTLVMGVLNVTPDSFSDGGRYLTVDAAVAHGIELSRRGADLVDVGGESTRPGAERIRSDEERERVVPVVRALTEAGVPTSIDTMNATTACAAVEAGAALVNDVSGGLTDPDMLTTVAHLGVPFVCMHWRGPSAQMGDHARYDDVVVEVRDELAARLAACTSAGIDLATVAIDPGIGFAKDSTHNWELLRRIDELETLGQPIVLGASRKRFLGALLRDSTGAPRPVDERDAATAAVSALAAERGIWCVRVHDPAPSRDAIAVATAWRS